MCGRRKRGGGAIETACVDGPPKGLECDGRNGGRYNDVVFRVPLVWRVRADRVLFVCRECFLRAKAYRLVAK